MLTQDNIQQLHEKLALLKQHSEDDNFDSAVKCAAEIDTAIKQIVVSEEIPESGRLVLVELYNELNELLGHLVQKKKETASLLSKHIGNKKKLNLYKNT
ncbi:hypothetical protein [Pseudoalteromonas sp. OOF1S-7]|uniref:hypothetical protein n=1 Tax=Pseudoalteromonas sp. OOF1S-7 TaxID=2917757 RepID=UPI001EF639DC|nr:hypothetical protein [Pseudoalteromonas sp. OOF1S-7]MCG7537118.1 hypothetical protein [Pseudoalteromonas sp. OOF1S-7]